MSINFIILKIYLPHIWILHKILHIYIYLIIYSKWENDQEVKCYLIFPCSRHLQNLYEFYFFIHNKVIFFLFTFCLGIFCSKPLFNINLIKYLLYANANQYSTKKYIFMFFSCLMYDNSGNRQNFIFFFKCMRYPVSIFSKYGFFNKQKNITEFIKCSISKEFRPF